MKVEFHIKGVPVSKDQKALIKKKLFKLKRYLKNEPLIIDIYLRDESSNEKGGVDQAVEISAVFANEQLFIREVDSKLMRAFAYAYRRFEERMRTFHQKRLDQFKKPGGSRLDKVLSFLKIKR